MYRPRERVILGNPEDVVLMGLSSIIEHGDQMGKLFPLTQRRGKIGAMRTMKIVGELMELPERLPDHPYFQSQAWSRKRNRAIYGMYVGGTHNAGRGCQLLGNHVPCSTSSNLPQDPMGRQEVQTRI